MQTHKTIAKCRQGYTIELPCNWVKDGTCGEDLKPCKIKSIHGGLNF